MKKFSLLALPLLIFAGCSLFPNTPPKEDATPSDPIAAYNMLSEKNRNAWKDVILDMIPEIDQYEISETDFTLKGTGRIEDIDGDINVSLTAENASDTTNPDNVKMKSKITLGGNLASAMMTGEVKGILEMVVSDASIFASLKELSVDVPNIPTSEIMNQIDPLIGKWYGDTFETLNENIGEGIDLQKIFAKKAVGPAEMRKKIGEIAATTNIFNMKKRLDDQDGFIRFEVELNKQELQKAILELAELSNPPENEYEKMKTDIEEGLKNVEVNGTLAFLSSEPKYFTFTGTVINSENADDNGTLSFSVLENKKVLSFSESGEKTGHATFEVLSEGDTDSFRVYGGETAQEEETVLTGKKSDSLFEAVISDPNMKKEIAKITLNKEGKSWAGKITNTDVPDMVINIDRLEFDNTSINIEIKVKKADTEIGSGSIEYVIHKAKSVDISAPESHEAFGVLMDTFLPMMSLGAPGLNSPGTPPPGAGFPPAPDDMTDEEFQQMIEEMMKDQGVSGEESVSEEIDLSEIDHTVPDQDMEALMKAIDDNAPVAPAETQ